MLITASQLVEEEGRIALMLRDDSAINDLAHPARAARDTSTLTVVDDRLVLALIEGECEAVRTSEAVGVGARPVLSHGVLRGGVLLGDDDVQRVGAQLDVDGGAQLEGLTVDMYGACCGALDAERLDALGLVVLVASELAEHEVA